MNKIKEYDMPSVRLSAGIYALSKLSAAGLTFMLVSLVLLGLPHTDGVPEGWPVSVPYAVYAYALPAALIADALLSMFRSSRLGPSLILYAAAGLVAGLWLASEQGGDTQNCGLYGIGILLLFRLAQLAGERYPLLLPVFALFVPLLCLVLQ
ncbi:MULTISPECIES: hypothetical protein [unclassified Paenibacillus]|uniref:hypothetical protein n=1 Tax=unclassified Paenibacillus TaxID=185978 RepID=UPI0024058826|nr:MULTISPECIES: hypothetical protein [unclassified Paenibacillus]MDF9840969.1 hypothetical protein [Paenibacillus sp. PastF-2]MDF9847553.1 hypothetical protein [Paenibacillus sp. PastM-2]MDF9853871.1 hypothetical protein [Paenibacillus sp. PastF-1]MDH6479142.1 hypothetical protein [Paenibacillus sp. PastH-2]MDH6507121.1 hypothetical protein [Paenibacillus sp. PastM-3]